MSQPTGPLPSRDHPDWGPVVAFSDVSADPEAVARLAKKWNLPSFVWRNPNYRPQRRYLRLADAAEVRAAIRAGTTERGA